MEKPETRLKRKIRDAIRHRGSSFAECLHGSRAQRRGLPDLIGCTNGVYWMIEVKMPGEDLRADQKLVIKEIKAAGGHVAVVTNIAEALTYIGTLQVLGVRW